MSQNLNNLFSAIADPFGATKPALIPDTVNTSDICCKDLNPDFYPDNISVGSESILMMWLNYGSNQWFTDGADQPIRPYCVCWCSVDATTGAIVLDVASKFKTISPSNSATLFGNAAVPNRSSALISDYRVYAMGLRVRTVIQTVIDNTITNDYALQFFTGHLTPQQMYAAYSNSANIITTLMNSPGSNAWEGASVAESRWNPFQLGNTRIPVRSVDPASTLVKSDTWRFPVVIVKMSDVVTTGSNFEVLCGASFWLDATLKLPTPIFSRPSPTDYLWSRHATVFNSVFGKHKSWNTTEVVPWSGMRRQYDEIIRRIKRESAPSRVNNTNNNKSKKRQRMPKGKPKRQKRQRQRYRKLTGRKNKELLIEKKEIKEDKIVPNDFVEVKED